MAKWRKGKTRVIRIPEAIADEVLGYARDLDRQQSAAREPEAVYRTAADFDMSVPVNVAAVPHRSPFRYPGGKTWLVPYVRSWLMSLKPKASVLVEPFAGGGIVGLTAAFERLAGHVVLVEKDADVASVWKTILCGQSEWLASRIEGFEMTHKNVTSVFSQDAPSQRERAFITILRNRVQRGGIMAPGAGLVKYGENGRGLLSRWYPETLARRIREIAAVGQRISFVEGDAFDIIEAYADDPECAFFVDPPYTVASRRLYPHWEVDHRRLFALLRKAKGRILVSYDDKPEIRELAKEFRFAARAVAMKNTHHLHMTELLIGKTLGWLKNGAVSSGSTPQSPLETPAFLL